MSERYSVVALKGESLSNPKWRCGHLHKTEAAAKACLVRSSESVKYKLFVATINDGGRIIWVSSASGKRSWGLLCYLDEVPVESDPVLWDATAHVRYVGGKRIEPACREGGHISRILKYSSKAERQAAYRATSLRIS